MKLVWKLAIPHICVVVCLGLISYVVVSSSFSRLRERYVRDVIKNRFQLIIKGIEVSALRSVSESSVFAPLPAVTRAYEIALSGDIDDPYSSKSKEARDLLRKELAPMLDNYNKLTGKQIELHFHLPNGLSLVRMWRDYNTKVDGEWVDISDDIRSFRPTVIETNRTGNVTMGLEPGSGGFAIRGVIPVLTNDGRQIGTAESLQQFAPILETVTDKGQLCAALYANKELLKFSVELQNPEKYPPIGDFVRVIGAQDEYAGTLITAELLSKGKSGIFYEHRDFRVLATHPLYDFKGRQVGVLVCIMNTTVISSIAKTASIVLALMLTGMVVVPAFLLLAELRVLISRPLNMVKAKIQDIAEDRADLSEQIPCRQHDEIGDLAWWFNKLTAKLDGIMKERQRMISEVRSESDRFEAMAHWYCSILDSISFPISVQNMEMRWVFFNTAYEKLSGRKRKDAVGLPCCNMGVSLCNTEGCSIACAKRGQQRTFEFHK
ncbi:MAG: hypothetical protein FWE67_08110, partial [Planctomycetaceae bacterium]|nr:hypothetical protein [Planctomycetaceae bacterium]